MSLDKASSLGVTAKGNKNLLVMAIGDSTTVGQTGLDPPADKLLENEKWITRVCKHLQGSSRKWRYANQGIGAMNTTQLYRDVGDGGNASSKPVWSLLRPDLVILAAGINNTDNQAGIDAWVTDTTSAVAYLNATMGVPLCRICILTMPPNGVSYIGGSDEATWLAVNVQIRTTVAALGCTLIEMEDAYDTQDYSTVTDPQSYLADNFAASGHQGIHPSAAGAAKWAAAIITQIPTL